MSACIPSKQATDVLLYMRHRVYCSALAYLSGSGLAAHRLRKVAKRLWIFEIEFFTCVICKHPREDRILQQNRAVSIMFFNTVDIAACHLCGLSLCLVSRSSSHYTNCM